MTHVDLHTQYSSLTLDIIHKPYFSILQSIRRVNSSSSALGFISGEPPRALFDAKPSNIKRGGELSIANNFK